MTGIVSDSLHLWDLDPAAAVACQEELRERLILRWDGAPVERVAGVDVHYPPGAAQAAIAVLTFPGLELVNESVARIDQPFPYVPGLLTFREGPPILAAWRGLDAAPDLVFFDGQGIAHPRGLGLAAHLGVWLNRPTIGVAKSRLYGSCQDPAPERGSISELWDEREPTHRIGAVVRTRDHVRPVYVSPGHRIDVPTAVAFTLACCTRYRLPEPIRWAHRLAGEDRSEGPPG